MVHIHAGSHNMCIDMLQMSLEHDSTCIFCSNGGTSFLSRVKAPNEAGSTSAAVGIINMYDAM